MIGLKKYHKINYLLKKRLEQKKVLIAVHRGSSDGNIIENTIPACQAALLQDSDLLEIDVIKSTDGIFYVFHDGNEKRLLNERENILTMSSEKIEDLFLRNPSGVITSYKVERLEDFLNAFKGEILINIDRAWNFFDELLPFLDTFNMMHQLIIKSPVKKHYLDVLKKYNEKYMYMPICHKEEDIESVLAYEDINLVGIELVADSPQHQLFQDNIIKDIKLHNLFVWANAINLHDKKHLFGMLDDRISILENPDLGWGKLFEKKIDIVQTDWPAILAKYRDNYFKLK